MNGLLGVAGMIIDSDYGFIPENSLRLAPVRLFIHFTISGGRFSFLTL